MAKKIPVPPVLREPVETEQITREIRDIHDMLDDISNRIFTVPLVVLDVNQSGSIGTFALRIGDANNSVVAVEFQVKSDAGGFPGSWSSNWTSSTGVIGDDTELLRQVNVGLQEGHNTTVKARVRYTDQLNIIQEISKVHTFDFDNVAEITGFEVGIEGATANISVSGDEDTVSVWYRLCGQGEISAVLAFNGRTGTFTFPLDDTVQCIEVAGKDSNGQFGPWVQIELHKIGVDKILKIPPAGFHGISHTSPWETAFRWYLFADNVGASNTDVVASVVLPPGVTITDLRARLFRLNTSCSAIFAFYRVDDDSWTSVGSITHASTGWITGSTSISELVQSGNSYFAQVTLDDDTLKDQARIGWIEIGYTTPSFEENI